VGAAAAATAAHGASDLGTAAARDDAPRDRKCSLGRGGGGRSRTGNRARSGGANGQRSGLPAWPSTLFTDSVWLVLLCSSRRSLAGWPLAVKIDYRPASAGPRCIAAASSAADGGQRCQCSARIVPRLDPRGSQGISGGGGGYTGADICGRHQCSSLPGTHVW
jgi:hypothetical protein